jgi:hypothetical protein
LITIKEHGALDETAKLICNCGTFMTVDSTQSEVVDMMLDLDKEEE